MFRWVTFSAECKYFLEFTDEQLERSYLQVRGSHAVETDPEIFCFRKMSHRNDTVRASLTLNQGKTLYRKFLQILPLLCLV